MRHEGSLVIPCFIEFFGLEIKTSRHRPKEKVGSASLVLECGPNYVRRASIFFLRYRNVDVTTTISASRSLLCCRDAQTNSTADNFGSYSNNLWPSYRQGLEKDTMCASPIRPRVIGFFAFQNRVRHLQSRMRCPVGSQSVGVGVLRPQRISARKSFVLRFFAVKARRQRVSISVPRA
jgi:hypothetical protein